MQKIVYRPFQIQIDMFRINNVRINNLMSFGKYLTISHGNGKLTFLNHKNDHADGMGILNEI